MKIRWLSLMAVWVFCSTFIGSAETVIAQSISGVVKAADTLQVLPGYTVRVIDESWNVRATTQTGSDGTYVLSSLPVGVSLRIEVEPLNIVPYYFGQFYQLKDRADQADRVVLNDAETKTGVDFSLTRAPNNSIQGKVRDPAGNGIPNITVYAYSGSADFGQGAVTDAQGNYHIQFLRPANDYQISTDNYLTQGGCYYQYWFFLEPSQTVGVDAPTSSLLCGISRTLVNIQDTPNIAKIDIIHNPTQPRTIQGMVTAKDTSLPIQGGNVWVRTEDIGCEYSADTNESGNYIVCGIPASSSITVCIRPKSTDPYYEQCINRKSTVAGSLTEVNFSLERAPDNQITGQVRDNSGNPIVNVWVEAYSELTGFRKNTNTNSSGEYTLVGLKPASDYRISAYYAIDGVWHSFYYYTSTQSVIQFENAGLLDVGAATSLRDINLIIGKQGNSIEGHVYGPDSSPVNGIEVNAWSELMKTGGSAKTNSTGYYKIWGLKTPTTPSHNYRVEVWSENYVHQYYNQVSTSDAATLVAPNSTGINFYLQTGGSVSGIVTNALETPIVGAEVSIWSQSLNVWRTATTNASGQYAIDNIPPAKDYIVSAIASGYPAHWYNQRTEEGQADKVDLSYGSQIIHFILNKGSVMSGTVYLGDTAHPAPEGVWVEARSKRTDFGRNAKTNSNGTYEIVGLNPNLSDYVLFAELKGSPRVFYNALKHVFRWEDATPVAPSEGKNIVLLSKGLSIRGKVTFNNAPVSGVYMDARGRTRDLTGDIDIGWGETFSTGEFTNGYNYEISGLVPGTTQIPITYTVTIHPDARFGEQAQGISLTDADGVLDFDLSEVPGRTISGTVSGLPEGKSVWIQAFSKTMNFGKGLEVQGTPLASITYSISSLPPASDYTVEMSAEDYPAMVYHHKWGWMTPDSVNVTDNDASGIDFTVPQISQIGSISGAVTFPVGAISGERVYIEAYSPSMGQRKGSEAAVSLNVTTPVRYTINGLIRASDYIVSVHSKHYPDQFWKGAGAERDAQPVDISSQSASDIDFVMAEGAKILGRITDENGNPLALKDVHAWSESSETGGHTLSKLDGTYVIRGLAKVSDFKIEASDWNAGLDSFYYSVSGTVRDGSLASPVSTESGNPQGINIVMSQGKRISGTVRSGNGKCLAGIWVSAWSHINKTGSGVFTRKDGTYEINGLSDGRYDVTVVPERLMPYLTQTLTDIAAGSVNVDFNLPEKSSKIGSCVLSGTVTGSDNKPVSGVVVEARRTDAPLSVLMGVLEIPYAETNSTGAYTISGLEPGVYTLIAKPPAYSSDAVWREKKVSILNNTNKAITLQAGKTITGKVTDTNHAPIKGVSIYAYSEANEFWKKTATDKDGAYRISQALPGTDYVVTAVKPGYSEEEKPAVVPSSGSAVVDLTLYASGAISGIVKDGSGKPLSGVLVEAYSENRKGLNHFSASAWTNAKGVYRISGLRTQDWQGNTIADYTVAIESVTVDQPNGETIRYMRSLSTGHRAGDTVNFTLAIALSDPSTQLAGSVQNSTAFSGDYVAADIFKKSGDTVRFERHVVLKPDGSFRFIGLDTTYQYYLGFGVYTGTSQIPVRYQWAAECSGCGYDKGIKDTLDHKPPTGAKLYAPGNTAIQFQFDTTLLRTAAPVLSVPGSVKRLRSRPPIHITLNRSDSDPQLRSNVQDMNRSPSETVTNSPTVTVTWEPSSSTADERYYYQFNQDPDFTITKRNAPPPSVTSRVAVSPDLSGDYQQQYFHIAVEDDRGAIGDTLSLGFAVDTVPPKNTRVKSNGSSGSTSNILLELGATGASEIYLSNTGYGIGGNWEKFTTSKEWKLSQTSSPTTVYIQFRDEAGNTANSAITVQPQMMSIGSVVSILQVLTGLAESASEVTGDNKITIEDAVYVLQNVAGVR